jgi:uncharacterized protein (TIGR03000 family)
MPPATPPATTPDKSGDKTGDKTGDKPEARSLPANRGRLIVEVPADAKLYIDDQPMKTAAQVRSFQTPDLEAGQMYYYIVRAEMVRDGQPVSETRRVTVKAGEVSRAKFQESDMVAKGNSK